jgi:hypothetical protein
MADDVSARRRERPGDALGDFAVSYQFRLGRCTLAIGRAWRIQGLSQRKYNIPCESGIRNRLRACFAVHRGTNTR